MAAVSRTSMNVFLLFTHGRTSGVFDLGLVRVTFNSTLWAWNAVSLAKSATAVASVLPVAPSNVSDVLSPMPFFSRKSPILPSHKSYMTLNLPTVFVIGGLPKLKTLKNFS